MEHTRKALEEERKRLFGESQVGDSPTVSAVGDGLNFVEQLPGSINYVPSSEIPLKLKFKKLHKNAVTPAKAHPQDAGYDLVATSRILRTDPHIQYEYGTGLAIQLPPNHVGLLFPRSSVRNFDLSLSNAVGVLDENFLGEIKFNFREIGGYESVYTAKKYEVGDRVGQLVVIPLAQLELEEVDELEETDRGSNGFGSTGV